MSSSSKPGQQHLDAESHIQRNPHPDFKSVESSRPPWSSTSFRYTQIGAPDWKLGQGATSTSTHSHISIDPYEEGRPAVYNYKLLISAIVPRPIGFISTLSADEQSSNLAPFSYTNVVNHDPPIFAIGFASNIANAKDTLKNLLDTKECTVNVISEHFLEAANSTSIDAPYGTSEWALSGLTPEKCENVKPSRVKEAVFSVEGRLVSTQEFESRATPGKKTGTLALVEGVRFWCREDALNQERNLVDPEVLRPMGRMGGITYVRCTEAVEIPRPQWKQKEEQGETEGLVKGKVDGQ